MADNNIKESDKKFNNKGFSLIEVMIALAIFSIGILGVASMQILSVNYNSHARRLTEATTRGVETLETLMILPYDSDDLDSGSNYEITDGTYTVSWDVTADPVLAYKTINMTVTWSERGAAKILRFNYIKSQVI
ncbi:MAG: prepilin-type N-terminal cleavage/methylation domain-containing protein [Pseudomonadota bacterium]